MANLHKIGESRASWTGRRPPER